MKGALWLVCLLGSVVAQSSLTGIWPAAGPFFDLPLVAVLYYAVAKGPTGALMAGAGFGLLQDALEGTLLGVNALAKATIGLLVGMASLRLALAPLASRLPVLATATVLARSIEVGTLAIMGRRLANPSYPLLLAAVLGNCLVGIFLSRPLRPEGPE